MTLSKLFETFQVSAFRLEGRPVYLVNEEEDALKFYKNTGRLPEGFSKEWLEFVRSQTDSKKTIQRLRLLSDRLSDYEAFELTAYVGVEEGEDIRFAKRRDYLYEYDFWLFDNRWLARMNYDEDGRYVDSTVSEITGKDRESIDGWLELYGASS